MNLCPEQMPHEFVYAIVSLIRPICYARKKIGNDEIRLEPGLYVCKLVHNVELVRRKTEISEYCLLWRLNLSPVQVVLWPMFSSVLCWNHVLES